VIALVISAVLGARAQTGGTVNFCNNDSTLVTNSITGSPATLADNIKAALYWAPLGSNTLIQIGAATPVGRPLSGLYAGGTRTTLTNTFGGTNAQFQVRAWGGGYPTYEQALLNHAQVAQSGIIISGTGNPGGVPPTPPAALAGLLPGLTLLGPPFIITQPTNQVLPLGSNALFIVVAGGTLPLSYQWVFNGTNLLTDGGRITGSLSNQLSITNVQLSDSGNYQVIVTNAYGAVTSTIAKLGIPPFITLQPTNLTATAGSNITIYAAASGSAPLSYQWFFNATNPVPGGTGPTLNFPYVQVSQAGTYTLRVLNPYGAVFSSNAVLVVTPPPCDPEPLGMVSWWRAENNGLDSIGTNNGALVGNTAFVQGEVGQAFVFDGNNSAVNVGPAGSLQLQDFTVECWIKRANANQVTGDPTRDAVFFSFGSGGYGFGLNFASRPLLSKIDVNSEFPSAPVTVTDTNWHHMAVTKSGSTVVFYVDGVPYAAPPYTDTFTFTTNAAVGAEPRGANVSNSFWGTVDELSVYNRALTANEILHIYFADSAGKCPPICDPAPIGLVSWWRFEGDAKDSFGTNNGALSGGYNFAPGEVGQAINLDGATGEDIVPNAPALNFGPNQDFSIEGWISPISNNTASGVMSIVDKRTAPNSSQCLGYEFHLVNGQVDIRISASISGNGVDFGPAGPDLRDGKFHHVAVTVARASVAGLNFYVDGLQVGSFDPTSQNGDLSNSDPLRIGFNAVPGFNSLYKGLLDEITLYNRALTSAEIMAIYQAGFIGKCLIPPCDPPPSGLIGWWKGDGNGNDSVAGNNATSMPGIYFTNGVVNQAFSCNQLLFGTGVKIPDRSAYALTNSLSIAAWVQPRGNGYLIFFRGDNRGGYDPYTLGMNFNNVVAFTICDANNNAASVSATLPYNQWWHVVGTLDGASGTMTIYTNGVIAAQTNTTIRPFGDLIPGDSPGIGIGNVNDGINNFPFLGDIDEVSLFNRALSQAEVQAMYNARNSGMCVEGAPIITVQPTNQIVPLGSNAVFTVTATGGTPLSYQWVFNTNTFLVDGGNLVGSLSNILAISNVQSSNSGYYQVIVTNSYGAVTSSVAILGIPPVILVQPTNQFVLVGSNAVFTVTAGGGPSLTYQWWFNTTNAVGISAASLTITNAQVTNSGFYSVVVTNAFGSATSLPALLSVAPPPTFKSVFASGGTLYMVWNSATGFYYQFQYRTDIVQGTWSNLGAPVLGTGGLPLVTPTPIGPDPKRFYRIALIP
jgi:hypothetical protein